MATVHAPRRRVRKTAVRATAGYRRPESPGPSLSFLRVLTVEGRWLLGAVLLLLGLLMTLTLWLLPMGLPIALVGMALIAAPDER